MLELLGGGVLFFVFTNFTVTSVIPTYDYEPASEAQKSILDSLPSSIDSVFLPPFDLRDLPEVTKLETIASLIAARSLSSLRDALTSPVAKTKLAALVVDIFATDAFDVAGEFNVLAIQNFPFRSHDHLCFFTCQSLTKWIHASTETCLN
ncbi:hypothetical protein DITRI_Ditri19aG0050600 [Diplodiscus trichospermus]